MGILFGTDGVRGIFNDDLTTKMAYSIGNALGSEVKNGKILIGRDTRLSGSVLSLAVACGAMNAGASVVDVGVCPTPAVSFLVTKNSFDFGIMITASHNPAEYNGIKIFDKSGLKINEKMEQLLEKKLFKQVNLSFDKIGTYENKTQLVDEYIEYLTNLFDFNLKNKKIVLDCANGASSFIAQKIFKNKGADVVIIGASPNGININQNCGALNVSNLVCNIKEQNADFGFAFDGDADRIVAVDKNGKIFNGDLILYIFAKYFKSKGLLVNFSVVGTIHTNLGVEKALMKCGIKLIRTKIGDKFVSLELQKNNLMIGGEQSGHIIIRKYLPTGDGILSAILLSFVLVTENKTLSSFLDFEEYYQTNINVIVSNKVEILESEKLIKYKAFIEKKLENTGRVMIRASGTEPCIRVMVETESEVVSKKYANELALIVKQVDDEINKCAE